LKKLSLTLSSLLLVAGISATAVTAQPMIGVGLSASTLGAGVQGAVSVIKSANIRGGFNAFDYSDSFVKDGINYGATLKLRSAQVTWDQYFPHLGGFHISPGALIYNGNAANASASVQGGQTFSLGSTTYYSSPANPVNGTGVLALNKAAPMILFGFGNLVPRSKKHFGFNVEMGVVFEGSAKVNLSLAGTACLTGPTAGCVNAGTDPGVQANVQSEQTKINHDLVPFKYYPVFSLGFSYKF
jgi:hypothetical protein